MAEADLIIGLARLACTVGGYLPYRKGLTLEDITRFGPGTAIGGAALKGLVMAAPRFGIRDSKCHASTRAERSLRIVVRP
jgi:hypothetical protein